MTSKVDDLKAISNSTYKPGWDSLQSESFPLS